MTDEQTTNAGAGPVERVVRPAAWALEKDGRPYKLMYERDQRGDFYSWAPLYDQAALDAALNLWPRDCRLCANYTTQTGGCVSVVQCVDSAQFKATTPRQYWISGPNDRS
jgi:hypothetical protein